MTLEHLVTSHGYDYQGHCLQDPGNNLNDPTGQKSDNHLNINKNKNCNGLWTHKVCLNPLVHMVLKTQNQLTVTIGNTHFFEKWYIRGKKLSISPSFPV